MKKIFNYFLQGLLYIAPISVTLYIIYLIFEFVDGLVQSALIAVFDFQIPGIGIPIMIIFLVVIGFLGQTIIARPLKKVFRRLLDKAPLMRVIYSAINDLFSAFVGQKKKFNKPVLVLVNSISNLEKLGFVTEEDLSLLNTLDKVAVYFPHSYNFSGELFIVPRDSIKPVHIQSGEVMKFIVSAGVSGWEDLSSRENPSG